MVWYTVTGIRAVDPRQVEDEKVRREWLILLLLLVMMRWENCDFSAAQNEMSGENFSHTTPAVSRSDGRGRERERRGLKLMMTAGGKTGDERRESWSPCGEKRKSSFKRTMDPPAPRFIMALLSLFHSSWPYLKRAQVKGEGRGRHATGNNSTRNFFRRITLPSDILRDLFFSLSPSLLMMTLVSIAQIFLHITSLAIIFVL